MLDSDYPRFHLALPVNDLDETLDFYQSVLGCGKGRESERWVDLNFFGHQLVLQLVDAELDANAPTNSVDGHDVPAGHFGPILDWLSFEALADRLNRHGIEFLIEPNVRFKGQPGEQATMF
ncbi:MAG: VOC family protein, partial [Pseudomonadota bacterium]